MILSQFCETMIRMSRNGRYAAWLVAAAIVSLVGCCGGGSTHKCDFTPPPIDAGSGMDAGMNCGNLTCKGGQVCCVITVFPFVSCIDPSQFQSLGCRKPPPMTAPCLTPHDCDAGAVCCLYLNPQGISCQVPANCPVDGTNVWQTCGGDIDCPNVKLGVCQNVSAAAGGLPLNVCQP